MRCCASVGCFIVFVALGFVDAELKLPGRGPSERRLVKYDNLTMEHCSTLKEIERTYYESNPAVLTGNMFKWTIQPSGFSAQNSGCWKFSYPMCGGMRQSPVHIVTNRRLSEDSHSSDHSSGDHSDAGHSDAGHSDAGDHSADHSDGSHSSPAADHSADHSGGSHSSPSASADHSADHSAPSASADHSADHSSESHSADHSTDHSSGGHSSPPSTGRSGLSQYSAYGKMLSKPTLMVDRWFKSVRADGDFGKIEVEGKTYHATHLQLVTSSLHKVDQENLEGELLIIHELHGADTEIPWDTVHKEIDTIIVSVMFKRSETSYSPLWEALGFPKDTVALHRSWMDVGSTVGVRGWQDLTLEGSIGSALKGNFYGYHGSLPVPPCWENVVYYVLEEPLPVHPNQLEGLSNVLAGEGLDFSQRPVQRELGPGALNNVYVEGSSTDSCNSLDEVSRQSTAVCWQCPAGARKSPVNIATNSAMTSVTPPTPGWDKPNPKYHATHGYAERGTVSLNVRPAQEGADFGILDLGGRFYTAEMIQFHPVATHTIDGVRYDGELHIHHYLYGDWFNHDTKKRRLDVFRGNTRTSADENVAGAPSYQVISVIPLKVTTNPGGDFMDQMQPHGPQSGEKPYLAHDDLKPILESADFYQYQGSLIWPACSSDPIHWIIYSTPLKVSFNQLFTEFPTRSGFDTTPNLVYSTGLVVHKNYVPTEALGSGKSCALYGAGDWTYADSHCWKESYPNCGLQAQSPINIDTTSLVAEADHLHDIFLNVVKYHPISNMQIKHTGHALQVADKMNGVSHLGIGYVEVGGEFYFLQQFHLHFPSEHVIDGHQHAGEIHLVHHRQDHWGYTGFENKDFLVAAIFFDIGPEESPFLKQLGIDSSLANAKSNWTKQIEDPVDLMRALGPILKGDYFRYKGSYTTPPCDEVIKWFVFRESLSMSKAQYEAFKSVTGFMNPASNRPVQPLNGRRIAMNSFKAPGETYDETSYEFWLDRNTVEPGRNRDKPSPLVVLGGLIGGSVLACLIMAATFIPQSADALTKSAGGLVASEPVGRAAGQSRGYRNMNDRI